MLSRRKFIGISTTAGIYGSFKTSRLNLLDLDYLMAKRPPGDNTGLSPFSGVKSYLMYDKTSDDLVVIAFEITDDIMKTIAETGLNATIFCYRLRLNNSVDFKGKNFYLLAKEVIATPNVSINSIGSDGAPFSGGAKNIAGQNTSTSQDNPALNANNADPTTQIQEDQQATDPSRPLLGYINGKNGGNIYLNIIDINVPIAISVNGGKGGQGQFGGIGESGADAVPDAHQMKQELVGFPRQNGGNGAPGGYGGNGGNFTYTLKNGAWPALINIQAGNEGDPGGGGAPGDIGGKGYHRDAKYIYPHYSREGNSGQITVLDDAKWLPPNPAVAKAGNPGPNDNSRAGHTGAANQAEFSNFYAFIPDEFVRLMMLKGESLYLNCTFAENDPNQKDTYGIFNFLYDISQNKPGWGFSQASQSTIVSTYLDYFSGYASNPDLPGVINQKSTAYLNQLNQKHDIFGNPPNYTPNINTDAFQGDIIAASSMSKEIYSFATSIATQQNNLIVDKTTNANRIAQADNTLKALDALLLSTFQEIITANEELNERQVVTQNLQNQLINDQKEFNDDLTHHGICGLSEIFHLVEAAVAVVVAVYTLGAATPLAVAAVGSAVTSVASGLEAAENLKDAYNAVKDAKDKIVTQVNKIKDDIDKVEYTIKDFQEKYAELNARPQSLMGLDTDKFDSFIDKFLDDYDSAKRFKNDYHHFVDYVNVTNQKRLDLTNKILLANQIQQSKLLVTLDKQKFALLIIDDASLTTSLNNSQSLFDLYYSAKNMVVKLLYAENKALQYQFPGKVPPLDFSYYDLDLVANNELSNLYSKVQSTITEPFSTTTSNVMTVNLEQFPSAVKAFRKGTVQNGKKTAYIFEFMIKTTDINLDNIFEADGKNFKVMGVQAFLRTKTKNLGSLKFHLTHMGNSTLTTETNFKMSMAFVHSPQTVIINSKPRTNLQQVKQFDDISSGNAYKFNILGTDPTGLQKVSLGVSPFASWTLKLQADGTTSPETIEQLAKDLESIDLYFWYSYQRPA